MAETNGAKNDMKAHEGTYGGFLSLLKIGTIISVIAAAVVIYLIAN
nr:aa3-type cytochrome c oxidase subunit IV [Sphingomonas laterariae]